MFTWIGWRWTGAKGNEMTNASKTEQLIPILTVNHLKRDEQI